MAEQTVNTGKNDDLEVWKYFNEEANNIKDKLWTIASWLYALMGGILALIAKNLDETDHSFSYPLMILVLSLVGIALSLYTWWMIKMYGWHVRTCWDRSNFLRKRVNGLDEIWKSGVRENARKDDPNRIPFFARRLLVLDLLFGGGFVVTAIKALIQFLPLCEC
jgi:hypothetical protein